MPSRTQEMLPCLPSMVGMSLVRIHVGGAFDRRTLLHLTVDSKCRIDSALGSHSRLLVKLESSCLIGTRPEQSYTLAANLGSDENKDLNEGERDQGNEILQECLCPKWSGLGEPNGKDIGTDLYFPALTHFFSNKERRSIAEVKSDLMVALSLSSGSSDQIPSCT